MNDPEEPIPQDVQNLIATHVESVIALEVLLLLYQEPQREWSYTEVASELRIEEPWTNARLAALERGGLIYGTKSPPHLYRYYPASMELNAAVAALARTYRERPLSVISFIYSRPSMVHQLADAFRLRG